MDSSNKKKQIWNQLEKEFFQETREFSDQEENKYEKWLDEKLKQLKRTFEQIKK